MWHRATKGADAVGKMALCWCACTHTGNFHCQPLRGEAEGAAAVLGCVPVRLRPLWPGRLLSRCLQTYHSVSPWHQGLWLWLLISSFTSYVFWLSASQSPLLSPHALEFVTQLRSFGSVCWNWYPERFSLLLFYIVFSLPSPRTVRYVKSVKVIETTHVYRSMSFLSDK